MKGLLTKDLITIKKYMVFNVIILIVFGLAGLISRNFFYISYTVPFIVLSFFSLFSVDETYKWDFYAMSLPVSRREYVLARYVLAAVAIGIFLGILFLGRLAMLLYMRTENVSGLWRENLQNFGIYQVFLMPLLMLLYTAIAFPVIYKFGAIKSRMFVTLIFFVTVFGGMAALFYVLGHGATNFSITAIPIVVKILPVVLIPIFYFLSFRLSVKIFSNKDL